jgi:hypothetical protein
VLDREERRRKARHLARGVLADVELHPNQAEAMKTDRRIVLRASWPRFAPCVRVEIHGQGGVVRRAFTLPVEDLLAAASAFTCAACACGERSISRQIDAPQDHLAEHTSTEEHDNV